MLMCSYLACAALVMHMLTIVCKFALLAQPLKLICRFCIYIKACQSGFTCQQHNRKLPCVTGTNCRTAGSKLQQSY